MKLQIACLKTLFGQGNWILLLKIWDDFHPAVCWKQSRVRAASLLSGSHTVEWDASHLASGVYLYKFQAGDFLEMRKMVLMK